MEKITVFRNENAFLSNMYSSNIMINGLTYKSAEAAFQAQKCIDPKEREKFTTISAVESKRLGRKVKLRPNWEQIKLKIMAYVVYKKFEQNKALAKKLIATENMYLEETNTWGDRFWGTVNGQGENKLGKILMWVRKKCIEQHW